MTHISMCAFNYTKHEVKLHVDGITVHVLQYLGRNYVIVTLMSMYSVH